MGKTGSNVKGPSMALKTHGGNFAGKNWRIVVGDCLDVLDGVPDGSVRLVVADPPYNVGVDYGDGAKADRLPHGEYASWCREWIELAARKLTADGSLWLIINFENAASAFTSLQSAAGLHFRSWITWRETFGTNCFKKFNRTSRPLLYFTKHRTRFVFNVDAVRVPSARLLKYKDRRANPIGKIMDDVWLDIPRVCGTFRERVKGPNGERFPNQLPIKLLRRIVAVASDPGDFVLDPFAGSATAGVAAIELGRRFLGIEKQSRFAALAAERLRSVEKAAI
jgi:site-specific DNA-methyltransferase (adenine-specific)